MLLTVFFSLFLWQCDKQDSPLSDKAATTKATKLPYEVTLDDAVQVAQLLDLTPNDSKDNPKGKVDATNDVDKKESVFDDDGKTALFHVINYAKGGFAIISADLRAMPVLAYSNSSSFDTQNALTANGLSIWFGSAKKQMKDIEKSGINADSIAIKEWKKYLKGNLNLPKGGRVTTNTNCQAYYTIGQYMCKYSSYFSHNQNNPNVAAPLLSYEPSLNPWGIAWGQGAVSNYYVPTLIIGAACQNSYYNGKAPAGCGPVAMAQVLWKYKPTSPSYNYSIMPQFSNSTFSSSNAGQVQLAHLMFDCGTQASSLFGMGCFCNCNTLTFPSNIPGALHAMGLSSGGSDGSFNPWQIENELYQGNPVIMHATNSNPAITGLDQHIWVCDGFDEHDYSTYNCDTGSCDTWSFLYLYFNWGWDYNSNAWYASGNFSPNSNSGNYNLNVNMISGIRK